MYSHSSTEYDDDTGIKWKKSKRSRLYLLLSSWKGKFQDAWNLELRKNVAYDLSLPVHGRLWTPRS